MKIIWQGKIRSENENVAFSMITCTESTKSMYQHICIITMHPWGGKNSQQINVLFDSFWLWLFYLCENSLICQQFPYHFNQQIVQVCRGPHASVPESIGLQDMFYCCGCSALTFNLKKRDLPYPRKMFDDRNLFITALW